MKKSDVIIVPIPDEILKWAERAAVKLDTENFGSNTVDGGKHKNIKGCLGQWAVHKYLEDNRWKHTYSKPYVEKQYGDSFDIKFLDQIWDVKCRDWWNEEYFFNIRLNMTKKERGKPKSCDYYVFCTVDTSYKNVYILGIQTYDKVWKELNPIDRTMKIPTAGFIRSNILIPLKKHIIR